MSGLGTGFTMGRGGVGVGGGAVFVKARGATVVHENRTRKRERKKKQGDCTYVNSFCCISHQSSLMSVSGVVLACGYIRPDKATYKSSRYGSTVIILRRHYGMAGNRMYSTALVTAEI